MDLEALARHHIETENRHDIDAIMETVAKDGLYYYMVPSGETLTTRAGVREFYQQLCCALPDLKIEVKSVVVDEGRRKVALEYRLSGTLDGDLWGLSPTHKRASLDGAAIYEFDEAGKLMKEIAYFDKTSFLESMGLISDTKSHVGQFLLIVFQSPVYALKSVLTIVREAWRRT